MNINDKNYDLAIGGAYAVLTFPKELATMPIGIYTDKDINRKNHIDFEIFKEIIEMGKLVDKNNIKEFPEERFPDDSGQSNEVSNQVKIFIEKAFNLGIIGKDGNLISTDRYESTMHYRNKALKAYKMI